MPSQAQDERQAQTEKILKQLDSANLGSGLLVVGNTKNDLGRGPVMIKQTFNPREINKGTISKMSHNRAAHGLLNHFVGNAITIMVDPKYIKGGLQGFKSDAYNNHVEWADAAKEDNAEMMLLNGNHRVTLMADTFEDEFYIVATGKADLESADGLSNRNVVQRRIDEATKKLDSEAVWLATFFDRGERKYWRQHARMLINDAGPCRHDRVRFEQQGIAS
jgi:hypothetical protein